jgi:hypothetical protein
MLRSSRSEHRPACLAALLLSAGVLAHAANEPPSARATEYQVKAAFLYNFLKFVEWPAPAPGAPSTRDGPLAVCVVGNPAFAQVLEEAVRGKTVDGRQVTVVRAAKVADARGCQEVFFAAPAPASISTIPGVLTVGEEPRFLNAGGILNLYLEDNRVRFEISMEGVKSTGLHVSAQLLKLGTAR